MLSINIVFAYLNLLFYFSVGVLEISKTYWVRADIDIIAIHHRYTCTEVPRAPTNPLRLFTLFLHTFFSHFYFRKITTLMRSVDFQMIHMRNPDPRSCQGSRFNQ